MQIKRVGSVDPSELPVVRVDPHDGRCRGDHDIIIEAFPIHTSPGKYHGTLTWGPSALLSIHGSREFAEALIVACDIAKQIEETGDFREAGT